MQKTAYEMRISDWSSDVCSSDLLGDGIRSTDEDQPVPALQAHVRGHGRMWSFLADQFDQVGPCKLSQPCIGNGLSGHGPVDLDQHLDRVFANVRSLLEDRLPFRQEPDRKSTRLNSSH